MMAEEAPTTQLRLEALEDRIDELVLTLGETIRKLTERVGEINPTELVATISRITDVLETVVARLDGKGPMLDDKP